MNAQISVRALTAQEVFKNQYGRTLRWSVLGALVLLVVAVLVLPEYQPVPYRLSQDEIQIVEIEMEAPPIEMPQRELPRVREVAPVPNDDPTAEDPIDQPLGLIEVPPRIPGWTEPVQDTPFVAAAEKPRLVQGAVADYPEIARLAGMQGTVVVKVLVAKDGSVARVEILKGVHKLLNTPAAAAARKLRFSPGTQRGMAVECWVAVPFRFYLR